MHQLHFMSLPRTERPQETREFEEPLTGVKLTFTLRASGATDAAVAGEVARQVCEEYLDGTPERPAGPFPDPQVKLSHSLILNAATLAEMQVGTNYSTIDFLILADRCPIIYRELLGMGGALNHAWGQVRGNCREAPTA